MALGWVPGELIIMWHTYWGTAYSQTKQLFKCRRCGEVGLRFPHEKCDCQLKHSRKN